MQISRATPAKFSGRSWGRRHSDGLSLRLAWAWHLEGLLRFCRLDSSIGKGQGSSIEFGGPIHHLDPTQVKFCFLISSIFRLLNLYGWRWTNIFYCFHTRFHIIYNVPWNAVHSTVLDFGNALFRKMRQSSTYLMIVHTAGHTFILPRIARIVFI